MEGQTILEAALDYAGAGHRVLPIWGVRPDGSCLCNDAGCSSPGKHPIGRLVPRGLKDATDDAEAIEAWWRQHPTANVGLVTGDDFFAVDCDRKGDVDGEATFLTVARERGDLPATATANTGGGGAHYLFAGDEAFSVRNQQGLRLEGGDVLLGVDVRGAGGYVVAPPSVHASGGLYEWREGADLLEALRAPPAWLVSLVADAPAEVAGPAPPSPTRDALGFLVGREVPDADAQRIRSALEAVPPNPSRTDWVERVSMPLHDHFGGSKEGYDLWQAWCMRADGMVTPNGNSAYGGEGECLKVWRSFSSGHRNPKGIATFWQWAQACGWAPATMPDNGTPAPPPPEAPAAEGEAILPWGDPEGLRAAEASPTMDLDRAFPPELHWLRDFVCSIARLLQVPAEFPLMLAAGMATGAYGRVYEIRVDKSDWREQAPLWVICAFQSGAGKSPVFRPIVRPFEEWDRGVDQKEEFDAWEARKDLARGTLMRAQGELRRKGAKARDHPPVAEALKRELLDARREVSSAEDARPASRQVLASSLTTPALVEFLQAHQERCLIVDPEGSIFQYVLGGRADVDKDIDPWVKAFSGDRIQQNRIGDKHRKSERRVERPCLAMALCTQVTSLGLFRDDYADGKGFLPRFMPAIFELELPARAIVEGRVPDHLAKRWHDAVHGLLSRPVPEEPVEIVLEGEGRALFEAWMQGWLDRARGDEDADRRSVVGYGSPSGAKVRSFALRIILMMHVLSEPDPTVPIDTGVVRTVLEVWMPFVVASVGRVVGLVRDDPDLRIAERILGWLGRHGVSAFSRAEAFRNLKSRGATLTAVTRTNDLNVALQFLVDAGWIQPLTKPKHRGAGTVPAASRYQAHPGLAGHAEALGVGLARAQ